MDTFPTVEEIIAKAAAGHSLTPWERSVHRLNVRPDGSRYSADKAIRDAQYNEDIAASARHRKGVK